MRSLFVRFFKFSSIALIAFFATACSKISPEFSGEGSINIPQPTINGTTNYKAKIQAPSKTTQITGECDSRIQAIEARMQGQPSFSHLSNVSKDTPSINCENNSFSFNVPSLIDMDWDLNQSQKVVIELRGFTQAGYSKATTIALDYTPVKISLPGFAITAGGDFATSGAGTKAQTSILFGNPTRQSSTNFQVVGDIASPKP